MIFKLLSRRRFGGYTAAQFCRHNPPNPAGYFMIQCDTLITVGWCIPVEPPGTVYEDYAVAIDEDRILDLLPRSEALAKYSPGVTIERPGQVLIPGLVNTHTHAAMTVFRGLADDLPLERWLREAIWPAEQRWAGTELVRDGTKLAVAEMLRAGITCFSDQYFFPETVAEVAAEAHMRAHVATPVIDFKTAWAESAEDCLNKGSERVHDRYADHPLITSCFAPHSIDTVSEDAFRALRVLADQLDCQVQMHLHESAAEIQESLAKTDHRPLERLNQLGLVNSSLLAVHAVHLTEGEIELFADSGVSVAHCPRSNLKLADGFAPVAALTSAGINVSLGTDGAASNNVLDILAEARTAALIGKAFAEDPEVLPAEQILRMATLDGARAIGLANQTGSIEIGKAADLTCIDLNRLHSQPVYDAISQVIYTAGADQVSDVWVAGRHLLDGGQLTHIDKQDVIQRANEWRDRITPR